jgi:peptide/nickel transport system permease protein
MKKFILRRLLNLIPVLLGVSLAAFVILYLLPGDPAELLTPQGSNPQAVKLIRELHHLDDPLPVRYGAFLLRLLQGDLGTSIRNRQPVTHILAKRILPTAQLAVGALIVAVVLGMTAGTLAAMRPRSWIDGICMLVALTGVSVPVFWLGMILILLLTGPNSMFEVNGYEPLSFRHLALPCLALGLVMAAVIARMTRSSLLEVLGRDYIRTARAKGVPEWRLILRHGLSNALVPIVTVVGTTMANLLAGAVLTETIFSIPGIGKLMFDAIGGRDYPVIVGAVMLLSVIFVLVNMVVDILYAWLDPRIRLE